MSTAILPPQVLSREALRALIHVRGLWTLLPLCDFEFHFIAFLQALIALGGDGAVVNKNVGPIGTSDESVPLRVIEPLDCAFHFQTPSIYPL